MTDRMEQLCRARSLTKGQYDAWCFRTSLISRQQATRSLPGDVVFSHEQDQPTLAFTQLGSYGATYGGFGLVKTSRRTWRALEREGLPVPVSETFPSGHTSQAAGFAAGLGYPVAVSALSGAVRRSAFDEPSFIRAFTEAGERGQQRILVASSMPGQRVRMLLRNEEVLAISGQGRRNVLDHDDLDPSLKELAAAALGAIPGLDIAGVTVLTPRLKNVDAFSEALVERVVRAPHLRDYTSGSQQRALQVADNIVLASAEDCAVQIAPPQARCAVHLSFCAAPHPEELIEEIKSMLKVLDHTCALTAPRMMADGGQMSISGPAADVAMIITRAIIGSGGRSSSHMVECRPAD